MSLRSACLTLPSRRIADGSQHRRNRLPSRARIRQTPNREIGIQHGAGCCRTYHYCFLRQQDLDTTTPAGKAMFQMMGVFAEFERAMIAERVRAGLARARGEGKRL